MHRNTVAYRSGVARIWCEGGIGRGAEGAEGVGVGGVSPSPLQVECGEGAAPPPQKIF